MSTIEDRLTAALHARADLVQQEALSAAGLPSPAEPRRPRPWTYAVLAAACAAAIGVPVVLAQTGDDPPASDSPDQGLDWSVSAEQVANDVDGDGNPDQLTLRVEVEDAPSRARLDVALSGGGTVYRVFEEEASSWSLEDRVDLDGDGADEIVLLRTVVGEPEVGALVLRLEADRLVSVEVADGAPFATTPDDRDRARDIWVDDQFRLFSSRSIFSLQRSDGGELVEPEHYQVEVWSWSLGGDVLSPELLLAELWCRERVPGGAPYPQPCAPSEQDLFDHVTRTIGVGEQAGLAGPDSIPTVSLDQVGDDITLAFSLSGNQRTAVVRHATPAIRAYVATVDLGPTFGLLVQHDGGSMELYAPARAAGALELLPVADVPWLGNGRQHDNEFRTFIAGDGQVYTHMLLNPATDEYRLWRWAYLEGHLVAEDLGVWCLDYASESARRC